MIRPWFQKSSTGSLRLAGSVLRVDERSVVSITTEGSVSVQVYAEVQQFYAHHILLMDECRPEETVLTFSEDAVMTSPPKIVEPIRGRAALLEGLRHVAATLAAEGVRYRRCHSMFSVHPMPDGRLAVRAYVQVVRTERGKGSWLHAMCVCEDVLIRVGGALLIAERTVTRDDQL